jgi:hypothetical protein
MSETFSIRETWRRNAADSKAFLRSVISEMRVFDPVFPSSVVTIFGDGKLSSAEGGLSFDLPAVILFRAASSDGEKVSRTRFLRSTSAAAASLRDFCHVGGHNDDAPTSAIRISTENVME